MEVIKVSPRGYCYGVVDALQVVQQAIKDPHVPRPVHILGQIIHNRHAVEEFTALGVITLDGPDRMDLLEQVTEGTVIFTAHGVSPLVKARARERGLHCIDATCPDVTVTHQLVSMLARQGYAILYIGKSGHPEPEGVLGEVPGQIFLVENEADVDALAPELRRRERLAVTTQTTLSQWDTKQLIAYIKEQYPHVQVHIDICAATQKRQEAVASQAKGAELTIVVGDPRSNNTNRLVQVSEEIAGVPAVRIEDLSQLRPEWLAGKKRIAVTAGASTPSHLTREVIRYLEAYDPHTAMTVRAPTTYLFTRHVELLQNALQREIARLRMLSSSLAVPALDSFYGQMGYHLGWLDAHFVPVQPQTGKLLRPTLLLLAYEATGAWGTISQREEKTHLGRALPAAVAIELFHNFTLVHDDIEDGDRERRHRPTAWAVFGIPLAINLGDGLASLSRLALFALLDEGVDANLLARLGSCFERTALAIMEGQHLDLSFETQEQVTIAHYLEMIARKTAALMACAAEMGARLGCSDELTIKALHQFGWHLGTAFQVRDDLLGIWATQAESGKTPAGDVLRRKKTLPVLHAIQHASPQDHAWLRTFYSQQEAPRSEQVGQVLSILEHTRSREYCQHFLTKHCLLARDALKRVAIPAVPLAQEALADLGALIEYVAEELWPMKAGDRAAVQEQALPPKAEPD